MLAFGPAEGHPGWAWTEYQDGEVSTYGGEHSEEAMAEFVREAMEDAGRIYHG